jgi:hypothetical protein
MRLDKLNTALVGFLQALGIAIYCFLVSQFFNFMQRFSDKPDPPHFLGGALMLLLLVFSVALCGILVFAYPVYLFINKKIKKALYILAYTLLFFFIIFIVALFSFII